MNSSKLNTIAGAVLFALLVTMGLGILSDVIFSKAPPETPGYEIVVADGDGEAEETVAEEPQIEPIAVRLASASAENGQKLTRACAACHDFTKGGKNKVGPALWGVVGRKPASHEGFKYSGSMTEYAEGTDAWLYENLDVFLTKPKDLVAKTSMSYNGLKKPEQRADLIAYLRSLADEPMPLPSPEAAAESSTESATEAATEAVEGAAEAVTETATEATETVTEAADSAKETVTEAAESAAETVTDAAKSAAETATDAAEAVKDAADSAAEAASDAAETVKDAVTGEGTPAADTAQ
ncbi:c-type cytochrome [Stappia indica]|uniref:c-type cytochrome n=1 Tax=Stappia indica TaxID=538381 RepID=UPI001CD27AB6|nr:cytochrome c family protein [Stappia indica]MCA1299929.1 cytochrome c family protein [Stappia indica]